MSFIFCICGEKISTGLVKPQFCPSCKTDFNKVFNVSPSSNTIIANTPAPTPPQTPPPVKKPKIHPKRAKPTSVQPEIPDDDDDDDTTIDDNDDVYDPREVPTLTADAAEVEIPQSGIQVDFSNVKRKKFAKISNKSVKGKQQSQKDFLNELKRDGGTSSRGRK